jgi:hypothetical protein
MADPKLPGAAKRYIVECKESADADWYRVYGPQTDVSQVDGTVSSVAVTKSMAEKYKVDRYNPYAGYKYRVQEIVS